MKNIFYTLIGIVLSMGFFLIFMPLLFIYFLFKALLKLKKCIKA